MEWFLVLRWVLPSKECGEVWVWATPQRWFGFALSEPTGR